MKFATILSAVLIFCISEVLGNACPRTNKKPGSECVDECQPSFGCSDSKKECLCDGDCGYSCVKKGMQCSPLKKIRNGGITGKDRTFNSTMTFDCNPKYTLFGPSIRRCRAKGLWDGKKSRCKISCPDPGIPNNTNRDRKVSAMGFSERTILRYDCLPGYRTTDSLSIKCQSDGQWSSSPPVCTVQQCGKVQLPANSKVRLPRVWRNKASHQLGTRIWVSCKPGYRSPVGLGMMRCESAGWRLNQRSFDCKGRSCGNPGTPRNGKKSGLSYTLNDVVRYSCNNCYKLTGVSYRQCLADGTWSDTLPTCTRVTCPNPRLLTHGTLSLSSQPIHCGSYVDYKCSTGYNLKGVSKRTCLGDGSWSGNKPICEIVDCGDPGHPRNGLTTANGGFTYGNDVTFSCNQNYVLEGSLLATCESNGKWSKSLPNCLEKCSDPSGNTNAKVIGKEFYHGKEVEFVCPGDSILVPSKSRKLTCQDGEWGGTIPSCKASCPSLPRLSDGSKSGRSRTHGSSVQFLCSSGHQLVGSSRVICNDGRWSDQMPKCLAICNTIRRIGNGWVYGRGNLEGDKLRFRCRDDYILDGEQFIKCTGNRRWNATKPTCRAPCRKLGAPARSRITQGGFKHNEEIHFECDPDYYLQGRNVLTCSDGTWNDVPPTCLAPCKRFGVEPFRGGYIRRDGYRHNEEVTFGCRDPLVIDGQNTLRCNDGTWNNRLPTCGGPCRKLAVPRNGVIIKNGYKHKETLTFGCKQGFQMVGSPDRKCNFAVWNDVRIPRCEAKCSNPNTNARMVGNEFYNGKEVEFFCQRDYVLIPEISKKLTCENGKWKGIIPLCKALCPPLSQIPNGNITGGKRRTDGSFAMFSCNAGYQQVGSSIAVCNDGTWSEKLPKCLAICKTISSIKNGKVDGKGRLEGVKISFVCDSNYMLDGEEVIKCTRTGKWNASKPVCKLQVRAPSTTISTTPTTTQATTQVQTPSTTISTTSTTTQATTQVQTPSATISTTYTTTETTTQAQPKNCPDITEIKKGFVKGSGVSPGSKRTFSCFKNWKLSGPSERTCLNSGQWSKLPPTCKLEGPVINCKAVGKIGGGFAIKNQSFHGGKVVFKCNANYVMNGKPAMLCKSGKWLRDPPKCYAPCKSLSPPQNGFIGKKSGIKHNDVIAFSCDQGYTLQGTAFLQCNYGSWDGSPPICQKKS